MIEKIINFILFLNFINNQKFLPTGNNSTYIDKNIDEINENFQRVLLILGYLVVIFPIFVNFLLEIILGYRM